MTEGTCKRLMKLAEFLAESEEKTIEEFMRIAGLKTEYCASEAFWETKEVLNKFHEAGYTIEEQQLKNGCDGIMIWRMTLLRDNRGICYQDIEIRMESLWGCKNE